MKTETICTPIRITSVDVFRAVTMLFMICVNDFWSLLNVPHWLEHALTTEDMLGFSDIIFPAFLFAVGLSIPLAIENRFANGDTRLKISIHILFRTLALLVMGIFIVNYEAGIARETGLTRPQFAILMVIGLFLLLNAYPKTVGWHHWKRYLYITLQILGIALLISLAVVFRDSGGGRMQKHWWGILGLIAWTYLPCALVYLAARKRLWLHFMVLAAFILLNIAGVNHWLGTYNGYIVSNGAQQTLTMTGIIVSLVIAHFRMNSHTKRLFAIMIGLGIAFLLAGFYARNFWIISKQSATPTWVFLCTGISVLFYVFLYWLVDMRRKERWFRLIGPAGTATLTCYLVPYVLYSIITAWNITFPGFIREYPIGLVKSMVFSLAAIGITALLVKIHVKLKV